MRGFWLAAIAVLIVARAFLIPVRVFDADEFENTHAAWSVFKGLVPYRDFFEHHTPWYYLTLSPFSHWIAVDQSFEDARRFLIFGRAVSLVLTAVSALLVFVIARRGATRGLGLLAALLFLAQPLVIQKTFEIRPDVPALAFFLGAIWLSLRGFESGDATTPLLRWFLGGGLCLGGAIMCTQKCLFVLPGAFVGLGLWALSAPRSTRAARLLAIGAVAVGVAAPLIVTWLGFAARGAGHQFIYDNFIINAKWRWRSSRNLDAVLETAWPLLLLGGVGAAAALRRAPDGGPRRPADILLLCTLGGLAAGLIVLPAAYKQYYLIPIAITCLFAARGLSTVVDRAAVRLRAPLLVGATIALLIWPALEIAQSATRRNDEQMARLRTVFLHTRPTDTVLDGWLGTAVFRPTPLPYFFLHREVQAMLSDADKDALLAPLEDGRNRPALIALDDELRALGPRFLSVVRNNYVSDDGVLYFPADRTKPSP